MKTHNFVLAALSALTWGLAGPALALDAVQLPSLFSQPVFLTAPTGDARLFVVEKGGRIQVLDNGVKSIYLDISTLVNTSGERGLLGMAFDPGFASNGRFYVDYIDQITRNTVVAAYTAPLPAANSADPASAKLIISVVQPAGLENHKAGWIGFRNTDPGQLYIATGDGGGGNDPNNLAQNLNSNLGKILRITPQAGGGYTVPASNPFAGAVAGNDEIWAYGLRNPYRNSFDRLSGDFWIADVGQDSREEVNFQAADSVLGINYGWRAREGSIDNPAVADPAPAGATNPIFEYAHNQLGKSIIGGYVYHGGAEPGLDSSYFFGDFVSGRIFTIRQGGNVAASLTERTADLGTPFGANELASFGEDGVGNIYAVGFNGDIYRIATAVPEPGTWAMLLGGLLLLGGKVRSSSRARRRLCGMTLG